MEEALIEYNDTVVSMDCDLRELAMNKLVQSNTKARLLVEQMQANYEELIDLNLGEDD